MADIRPGVVSGLVPPQVRLDGSASSVPLAGWAVDPAALYGERVQVAVRSLPGSRTSSLWLVGAEMGGPQRALWGVQAAVTGVTAATKLPLSGSGAGTLAHTVTGNEVTVARAGWYWLSAQFQASVTGARAALIADGTEVAAALTEGTLTALEWLAMGATVYVQGSASAAANFTVRRLTITRL